MTITYLNSQQDLDNFIKTPGLKVVHFNVTWNPTCSEVDHTLTELHKDFEDAFNFANINAENNSSVSLKHRVTSAPTNGKEVDRVVGFDATSLKNLVIQNSFDTSAPSSLTGSSKKTANEALEEKLKKLINKSRLTLFMKGNPQQPKCGFSKKIIEILNNVKADYWTFDILNDEEIRQGLKKYSDWPTYPQLYLDGELLGGLDIIQEEIKDAKFVEKLPKLK